MITAILCLSQFATVMLLLVFATKQAQPPPKKPRTPQKSLPEYAHKPLRFLDFSPAEESFTCIWPNKAAGGRCRLAISQTITLPWANTVRNSIADDSPDNERVRSMLREYAELCLCERVHRPKSKTDPAIIQVWVKQWLEEIRALRDSLCDELGADGGVLGEGVLLYAQTTLPESTSDDENPDREERPRTNTPLKNETSDGTDLIKYIPGSFPDEDILAHLDLKSITGLSGTDGRRSSTSGTPSARIYSQVIRSSPLGAKTRDFTRSVSATPRLGSKQTGTFERYPNRNNGNLRDVLTRALGSDERKPGHLYIFTRRSDNNSHSLYIKIGKAEDVTDRLEQWKTRCHYKPHLEYETPLIPNALRAELLVQTELIEFRYRERQCSGCGQTHDEWFKTDVDTARPVVERWAKWIQECRPYEKDGRLSSRVVQGIFEHKLSQTPLTSKKMLMCTTERVTTEAAMQQTPESSSGRSAVHSIEHLDPPSPTLQKSIHTATATSVYLSATLDEEDSSEPMKSNSPLPNPFRMYAATSGGRLDVKRTRKRTAAVKVEIENAVSGLAAEFEEVKANVEHNSDMIDPILSDVEVPDSQEVYHDAQSFPEPGACAIEAKSEHEAPSLGQQPTTSGLSEGMGVPTGVQCAA